MDLTKIKSAVLNQLTGKNGLYSLKLQNHIYGCFIVMEDIAQQVVDLSGSVISTPKFSFDLDKQFCEIGIRYGFAMDSKLVLDNFNSEYKDAWLECFKDIDLSRDIGQSDAIEDAIIEIIQSVILIPEEAFFLNALDNGSLPQEWIERAFSLINLPLHVSLPHSDEKDIEVESSSLTKAVSEKPLNIRKRLSVTRRAHSKVNTINKKNLAKTRRHR